MNYNKYMTKIKKPNLIKKELNEKELKVIIADNTIGVFHNMLSLSNEVDNSDKFEGIIKLYQNLKVDNEGFEHAVKQYLNTRKPKIFRFIYNQLKDNYTLERKEINYNTIKLISKVLDFEELFKLEYRMTFGAFLKNELKKAELKLHPKDLKDLTEEEFFAVYGHKPITDPKDKLFFEKFAITDIKQYNAIKARFEYEHRKEKNKILKNGTKKRY